MSDDFLFDDQDLDNDFSLDLNMYLESFEKGNDAELIFSEDSYDFLLDHFLEKSRSEERRVGKEC